MHAKALTLALLLWPSTGLAGAAYEIAMPAADGTTYLHFDKKPGKNLETKGWLQFHARKNGGFALAEAALAPFKVFANECFGGFDANSRIKAPKPGRVFLMRGPKLKAGEVKTVLADEAVIEPGKAVVGKFDGKTFSLSASGSKAKKDGEEVWSGYEVKLAHDGKVQSVFVQGDYQARPTALLWAGDLDGDGRLDLLMNLNYWAGASGVTLLLSSAADPKTALVKDVARDNPEQC